jgi:quercetin dioxygenase-like cupin family protein
VDASRPLVAQFASAGRERAVATAFAQAQPVRETRLEQLREHSPRDEEEKMKQHRRRLATASGVAAAAALIATALIVVPALATPSVGVTSTPIGQGSLDAIDVKGKTDDWKVRIKTKGQSNLVVVENRVAPGGHFGWHSHPGPSLVIVKSGTATFYRGDDPTCTPQVYEKGEAFADPTGGVVHVVRNEGIEELVVIVTRVLPAGAPPRADEPNPGNCPF